MSHAVNHILHFPGYHSHVTCALISLQSHFTAELQAADQQNNGKGARKQLAVGIGIALNSKKSKSSLGLLQLHGSRRNN
ncbi:hypothetical protein XENTR_v10009566 [Xenopus tropicalis]|nr:hypothetical protein XENTR_v10009566 [Xenopus tropicalis]